MPPARLARRPLPRHGPWPDTMPAVLQRVYAARGVTGTAVAVRGLATLPDLVAVGTVADLVSLDGNHVAGLSSVLPTPTDGVVLEFKPERSRDS